MTAFASRFRARVLSFLLRDLNYRWRVLIGALLALTLGAPATLMAQTNILQDNSPGSMLVFPIFDAIGGNQTKLRIVNDSSASVQIRVIFACQPNVNSNTAQACHSWSERFSAVAQHETIVLDVADELLRLQANCQTRQGYVVAIAERMCPVGGASCPTSQTGTQPPGFSKPPPVVIAPGQSAPISWNFLSGSLQLFYNGFANAPNVKCAFGVPCSPPPVGPVPDVEEINAISIQSQQPQGNFLGKDTGAGTRSLTFGTNAASDYAALPGTVGANFAAPGASLVSGPVTVAPFIPTGTSSGTELQTNAILLNLQAALNDLNQPASLNTDIWNWFSVGFTSTHQFTCWERLPIDSIDNRITAIGAFGAPYGNLRFTPVSGPALLAAIEQVSTVGRTLRTMSHSGSTSTTLKIPQ